MKEYIKLQRWVEINEGGSNPKKEKRNSIIFKIVMAILVAIIIFSGIMAIKQR